MRDPEAWTSSSQLLGAYRNWAQAEGIARPLGPNHFAESLKALGFEADRRRPTQGAATLRGLRGLRLDVE